MSTRFGPKLHCPNVRRGVAHLTCCCGRLNDSAPRLAKPDTRLGGRGQWWLSAETGALNLALAYKLADAFVLSTLSNRLGNSDGQATASGLRACKAGAGLQSACLRNLCRGSPKTGCFLAALRYCTCATTLPPARRRCKSGRSPSSSAHSATFDAETSQSSIADQKGSAWTLSYVQAALKFGPARCHFPCRTQRHPPANAVGLGPVFHRRVNANAQTQVFAHVNVNGDVENRAGVQFSHAIKATGSAQGTTCCISSRNTRRRVFFNTGSGPKRTCSMFRILMFKIRNDQSS
jgi:hypothetical protein